MKKTLMAVTAATLLLTTGVMAEETKSGVSDASGGYVGLGGGISFNLSRLGTGDFKDDTTTFKKGTVSDSSGGYLLYGGYQFNKIIAVEASYIDYGHFEDELESDTGLFKRTVSSDPYAMSVYANAGYTFENGLRPFGQLGLGYAVINASYEAENIGLDDDGLSIHFGLGLEYAPEALKGFGFRVAYVEDLRYSANYDADDNGDLKTTSLMIFNGMMYVGAQYKF